MSTKKAAVLGKPIEHSLSPTIHNLVYSKLNLDWSYEKIEIGEGQLGDFLSTCSDNYVGFSVTMPLKSEAFNLAATRDSFAEQTGAVNTLVRNADAWDGYNTDVPGAIMAMTERGFPQFTKAKVLGAGATARSLIVAASEFGVSNFEVFARRFSGFQDLENSLPTFNLEFNQLSEQTEMETSSSELLINTLPGTVADFLQVKATGYLFDVTYAPWPTRLSTNFESDRVVSGKDLLVHQALFQVRLMTGLELPNQKDLLEDIRMVLST